MSGLKGILYFLLLFPLLSAWGEGITLSDANRQLPLAPLYQTPLLASFESLNLPTQLDSHGHELPWKQLPLKNQSDDVSHWVLTQPLWVPPAKIYLLRHSSGSVSELPLEQLPAPMPVRQLALTLDPGESVTFYLQGKQLPQTLWKRSWWQHWDQVQRTILLLIFGAQLTLMLCLGLMSLLPQLRTPLAAVPLLASIPLLLLMLPPSALLPTPPFWPIALTLAQACANYRLFQHEQLSASLKKMLIMQTLCGLSIGVAALGSVEFALPLVLPVLLIGCLLSALSLLQLLMVEHQGQWLLLAGVQLMIGTLATSLASGPELENFALCAAQPLLMSVLVFLYLCQQLMQPMARSANSKATLKDLVRLKESHLLAEQFDLLQNQYRELELQHRLLQEKNAIDFLTGLRNRQFFDERFSAEMARSARESTPISLLLIDIDHFKDVNDRYGHRVGDEVLKSVAKRFYYVLKRPSDAICRYGGEEFAIILPNTHGQGALHIAELILNNIRSKPVTTAQGEIHCTVSIGIASTVHSYQQNEGRLIEDADKALYRAKQNGRDRIELAPSKPYVVKDERPMKA